MTGFQELSSDPNNVQDVSVCVGMKSQREKLTQKRAKELLDYDPETGLLTWKVNKRGRGAKVGGKAGSNCINGYLYVGIDSKRLLIHRVVWLWYYGYFPENDIDHINRVRSDNRICNLREVSRSCNNHNSCVPTSNTSGIKGVGAYKGGFRAYTEISGSFKLLRSTKDFTEAVAHRLAAEQCLGYSSCDTQSSAYLYMQKYLKEVKAQN